MTHLPFIAAAYGIGLATIAVATVRATLRLRRARRRLEALDTRRARRAAPAPATPEGVPS